MKLPKLPRPAAWDDHGKVPTAGQYSVEQMRAYAKEAVDAALISQVPAVYCHYCEQYIREEVK